MGRGVARWCLAVLAGILYAGTLAPTVLPYGTPYTLDSPMLQPLSRFWGRPSDGLSDLHAAYASLYLPAFRRPAYRVNLASAVYGAAAVLFVYLAD